LEKSEPKISIIIPCRNEERYIGRCLDSLLANDVDFRQVEIVVVDGMSSDRTREIVDGYARDYPSIRLAENPKKNKPAALNLGIRVTSGDVIIRIDAHATYATNYISKLVAGLEEYHADNIGGIRETCTEGTPWQRAVGLVISHRFAVGNAFYRTGVTTNEPREVDTVFCGCYRREVFEEIGIFHPKLIRTQDREFNARLTANGGTIVLDPSIRCTYHPRTGFGDYARWTFSGAFWVYYARRFTATRMKSLRNLVPGVFVGWHALAALTWLFWPELFIVTLLPILAYWAQAVFFSIEAAWRNRSAFVFPSLILLFGTTHYVYGLGSWAGLLMSFLRGTEYVQPPDYRRGDGEDAELLQPVNIEGARSDAA